MSIFPQPESAADARQLSPGALAFVGDGVIELLVRQNLLDHGTAPVRELHARCVERVNAGFQSACYPAIEAVLNDVELAILKRGRNVSTSRVPKSCTPAEYSRATAVEALFGYLYLSGDFARVEQIFDIMENMYKEQHLEKEQN